MQFPQPKLIQTLTFAFLICFSICASSSRCNAQTNDQLIFFSEFFEELFQVNPNGTVSDILSSNPFDRILGQQIEVLNPDQIIISDFTELHLYDVASRSTSLVADLSFVPREIARDGNGGLIAIDSRGVFQVDLQTGTESLLFDDSFFSPRDVAVGADGRIFITEFFDALGFIDPNSGTFTQIGNFDTGAFGFLDIGIDGNLYASSGRDFFRIDPLSGEADLVGSFDGTSVREIQVDADGNILFSGSAVLGDSSIFSLDPLDGSITTIINGDDIDTFFSIQDFDVFSPELRVVSAVPEPTSVTLFGLVAMVCCCRRRRFSLGL